MPLPFDIEIPLEKVANVDPFEKALLQFDAINRRDPQEISYRGHRYPAEYLLAQALCHHVIALTPSPSEPLLLASRCQHLGRWAHPRKTYPEGRAGYLKWRADLKIYHADQVAEILRDFGYDEATMAAVRSLNLKEDIKKNPDCQTLEDGLCLVFLQFQYDDIVAQHPEEKVIRILKKTAGKMSAAGLEAAGKLNYSTQGKALLHQALSA